MRTRWTRTVCCLPTHPSWWATILIGRFASTTLTAPSTRQHRLRFLYIFLNLYIPRHNLFARKEICRLVRSFWRIDFLWQLNTMIFISVEDDQWEFAEFCSTFRRWKFHYSIFSSARGSMRGSISFGRWRWRWRWRRCNSLCVCVCLLYVRIIATAQRNGSYVLTAHKNES